MALGSGHLDRRLELQGESAVQLRPDVGDQAAEVVQHLLAAGVGVGEEVARVLAERCAAAGEPDEARRYLDTAYRLWLKVSPLPHVRPEAIETYGGQPNKQAADLVTTFDPGRMIWHGYTGAAGWMLRQAVEGVLGLRLRGGEIGHRSELGPAAELGLVHVTRDVTRSPLEAAPTLRPAARSITAGQAEIPTERQPTATRGG